MAICFTDELLTSLRTDRLQEEFYAADFPYGGSFGVRVSKTGRKVFFIVYCLNKKRRRFTLGAFPVLSLNEAKEKALEILRLVEEGRDPATERRFGTGPQTFQDLVSVFRQRHLENLRQSTRREYERIIKSELLPRWSNRSIESIGGGDIFNLLQQIAEERQSPIMANRTRALVSKVFNWAKERGLASDNPAQRSMIAPEREQPAVILSWDEIGLLWRVTVTQPVTMRGVFRLMLLTGQRPCDVLALRWRDVEFDWWTVPPRKKDSSPHRVYLSLPSVLLLRDVRGLSEGKEFVFASPKGGHVKEIRKTAVRLNKEMGSAREWRPFDLRRTMSLRMRELNVRPDVIEYILNGTSRLSRLISRGPGHDYRDEAKKALTLWAQKVLAAGEPAPQKKKRTGKVVNLFG